MTGEQRDYYLASLGIVQYVPREFVAVANQPDKPLHSARERAQQSGGMESAIAEAKKPLIKALTDRAKPRKFIDIEAVLSDSPVGPAVTSGLNTESARTGGGDDVHPAGESVHVGASGSQRSPAGSPVLPDSHPGADSAQRTTQELVKLRICCWHPVENLLVFSALNYGENPPQGQHKLLENILKAISKLNTMLAEPEFMDWPLTVNATSDKQGAKSMFSAFLQGRLKSSGATHVLLIGERAKQFLLPESYDLSEACGMLSDEVAFVAIPGLEQMLGDAANKKVAWQVLRTVFNGR